MKEILTITGSTELLTEYLQAKAGLTFVDNIVEWIIVEGLP